MRIREVMVATGVAGVCLLAGCGSGGGADAAVSTTEPAAASTSAGQLGVGGRAPDGWPAETPQEAGERVFGIYLAVGPAGDPQLAEAAEYVRSLGYSSREPHRLACDEGAAEALRRDPAEQAVAVYFEWRDDAGDFTAMHKDSGMGFVDMVRVTRTCAA